MLKKNEWTFWVKMEEIPKDCVLAMSISDDVLDKDCWPVWCVVLQGGTVVQLHDMYRSEVYDRPDMMKWSRDQIADWVQEADGASMTHPMISHDICWMTAPEDSDYWFTVAINKDKPEELIRALSILGYFQIQMEVILDDQANTPELIVVRSESRDGDLIMAEMAFTSDTWRQSKVCPLCEADGETICGHMHFYKWVQPAF